MPDEQPKHRLEVTVERDQARAGVGWGCECNRWSGFKNIDEPTPGDIGNVVRKAVVSHRDHVWSTGMGENDA